MSVPLETRRFVMSALIENTHLRRVSDAGEVPLAEGDGLEGIVVDHVYTSMMIVMSQHLAVRRFLMSVHIADGGW